MLQRKANDYLIVDNLYTVVELKTQQPYEFRVIAHNAVGPSEHSLPSMAATPRDPEGANLYLIKDLRLMLQDDVLHCKLYFI